jgi:hypothetical protein
MYLSCVYAVLWSVQPPVLLSLAISLLPPIIPVFSTQGYVIYLCRCNVLCPPIPPFYLQTT